MAEGFVTITIPRVHVTFSNSEELDPLSCAEVALDQVLNDMRDVMMFFEVTDEEGHPLMGISSMVNIKSHMLIASWVKPMVEI